MASTSPLDTTVESTVWRLPADLGIESLERLVLETEPALAGTPTLILDGSEVTRLHAACLQWLAVVIRSARGGGRDVIVRAPSAAYREAVVLMGLTQELLTDA